jgi:hypothetical protein
MPANIVHRDLFEVKLSHEKQPLQIYSNTSTTLDPKKDPSNPTNHVGNLSDLSNKLLVLPVVLPKSNRTMHMGFNLKPGFDFGPGGNAVIVGLRVRSTIRGSELILKEGHETKQPDSSSGFHWGRIQLAQAAQGTMVITVTRGVKAKKAKFVPLVGEGGKAYSIEIEWRVLKTRPDGAAGPEEGRAEALSNTTASLERTATVIQPRVKHTATKVVTPTKQDGPAKPAIALTAANPHPSDDDHSKVPLTPSTNSETPNHGPEATVNAGASDMFPPATPTSKNKETKPSTSKRSAAEAFGPEQADGEKSTKQLQLQLHFQLRKAKAMLGVAKAKWEQVAARKVGQDDKGYLQALHSKAEAVHRVAEVEFEIKAAEHGDKNDPEYLELQTREAVAYLEVVEVEEMLQGNTDSTESDGE